MPFIDSRGHRRPLDPRRGVDEPRTVEVVRPMQALARLGERMTVVPGWRGKFLTAALAMLPRRLRIRVLALVIRGMRNPQPALAAD
jgi:hypothetical protein